MKQRHGKRRTRTDRGTERKRGEAERAGGVGGGGEDKNKVPQFYKKKEAEIRKQKLEKGQDQIEADTEKTK